MIDITPFIDDLSKLNDDDRQLVMNYYSTWSEDYPSTYPDGKSMTDKMQDLFREWLKITNPENIDIDELMDYCEEPIRDYVYSYWELDPQTIVDLYRGIGDHELFQDILDEYLVDSE